MKSTSRSSIHVFFTSSPSHLYSTSQVCRCCRRISSAIRRAISRVWLSRATGKASRTKRIPTTVEVVLAKKVTGRNGCDCRQLSGTWTTWISERRFRVAATSRKATAVHLTAGIDVVFAQGARTGGCWARWWSGAWTTGVGERGRSVAATSSVTASIPSPA